MKKILFVLSGIIICLLAIVLIVNSFNKSDKIIYKNSNEDSKSIINSNALTMMYETDYQSGEYQVSIDTIWPREGYAFNEQLSSCENDSTLRWDDENKRVIMSASVSDKCYVYFDKTITFVEYINRNIFWSRWSKRTLLS